MFSCVQEGVIVLQVMVEVYLFGGLFGINIVGLFEVVVCEVCDCVCVVIQNIVFSYLDCKVMVNLVLVELFKDGGCFDFVIVLGILVVGGQVLWEKFDDCEFLGELVLFGVICGVFGVLLVLLCVWVCGCCVVVLWVNVVEVVLVFDVDVMVVDSLVEVCGWLYDVLLLVVLGCCSEGEV